MIERPRMVCGMRAGLSRREFTAAPLAGVVPVVLGRTGAEAAVLPNVTPRLLPARELPVPDTVSPELQVFEGQSHAQFLDPFVPETQEAFGEIAGFLGHYLAV